MSNCKREEKIIQFGEGVFLRGFVDVFLQRINDAGLFNGGVVVVKPIADKAPAFDMLCEQNGKYTHFERGLKDGIATVNKVDVDVISRLINPYEDFDGFVELAKNPDMKFIVSNTTEAGITYTGEKMPENKVANGYPAKVTQLLYERYKAGLGGFYIIACELIDNAGDELKKIVLKHAVDWNLGEEFERYVKDENKFYNSLVDRIVTGVPKDENLGSEYDGKIVNTSELFHFWVLQGDEKILAELPFDKAGLNVMVSNDIDMYHTRKVRILNGAHTSLVPFAMLNGLETVGECMENDIAINHLEACLSEVIESLDMDRKMVEAYKDDVLERFKNPYIKHYLKAIALNSVSKFKTRVLPSIVEYYNKKGEVPKNLAKAFAYLIKLYKTDFSDDMPEFLDIMKNSSVEEIVLNADLWGENLSFVLDEVKKYVD